MQVRKREWQKNRAAGCRKQEKLKTRETSDVRRET